MNKTSANSLYLVTLYDDVEVAVVAAESQYHAVVLLVNATGKPEYADNNAASVHYLGSTHIECRVISVGNQVYDPVMEMRICQL